MNYQALAGAQVSLFDYLPALQTDTGLQVASFDQLLAVQTKPSTQLAALADALANEGQPATASAVRTLSSRRRGACRRAPCPPSSTLDPTAARIMPAAARGAGGQHQRPGDGRRPCWAPQTARASSRCPLDTVAPGLAGLKGWLAIGQRPSASPWLAIDSAGSVTVRTAQMRLYLQASVAPGGVAGLSGGALMTLPLYVEAASAQASLTTLPVRSRSDQGRFRPRRFAEPRDAPRSAASIRPP